MRLGRCLVVSALTATWALDAEATYSIVAVDTRDGTVGGAVASCVPGGTLDLVYGVVPGRGALVTQSYLKEGANADGLALFEAGGSSSEVVAALTAPAYDAGFQLRQYAAVDVQGGVVTFTGSDANAHASGVSFSESGFSVAIQGNYLTGPEVIAQARAAFTSSGGCDLAVRLHAALAAAGSNGAGDRRCTPDGVPAQSAVLEVDPPGMTRGSFLRLAHEAPGDPPSEDPVAKLGVDLGVWRASHPCPVEEGGGGAAPGPEPAPSKPADEAHGCTTAPRRSADGSGWSALALAIVAALRRRRTGGTAAQARRSPARVPSNGMSIVLSGRSAWPLAARALLVAALLGLFAFASGCAPVRPWEHGLLAHPTMAVGSLASEGEAHLHAISEGATGGSGGVGSGCGCN